MRGVCYIDTVCQAVEALQRGPRPPATLTPTMIEGGLLHAMAVWWAATMGRPSLLVSGGTRFKTVEMYDVALLK